MNRRAEDALAVVIAGAAVVVLFLGMTLGIAALSALLVQWVYNAAIVPTFHTPRLTFLATWACLFIIGTVGRLLFGSRGGKS
jgi:tryptophan-rich sensory protein